MKKTFTLAAIGLLAAFFLSAGALLIGRYDQPKDDDSGVERLSAPVSQIGSGSAQQVPNGQPIEQSPTAGPLDPPTEAPQTSLQPKEQSPTAEPLDPPTEAPQTSLRPKEQSPTVEPQDPPAEAPQTSLQRKKQSPAVEPQDPPAEAPLTSLDSTREVKVDFRRFRQLIPRDAINPIYRPRFIPAESAALNPEELVIGVAINGESKAYPVGPLNRREMVNDVVGGVPILVTW